MRRSRPRLLVAQSFIPRRAFEPLKRYGEVYWYDDLSEEEQGRLLPTIDCVYSHGWPRWLDASKLARMANLRLLQTGNAGVNAMRFDLLDKRVVVCSNAGAYSDEVAEFAIGLMLAAAKRIVGFDLELRNGEHAKSGQSVRKLDELGSQVASMKGRVLGVIGYGGIGRSTARLARPFGMKVLAFGRHLVRERGVISLRGEDGLARLLRESDIIVLAVPLTKSTKGLIGEEQLSLMKREAILVNVARGEVVKQQAIYDWLVKNPKSCYATDVWWPGEGTHESFSPELPFLRLHNFIGTPHVSGLTALHTGNVAKGSVENLMRYFKGQPLKNVVDRSEYG